MDVSLVILTWNSKQIVEMCVRSAVEHETRYSMEVIVVDNASTDGVPEMIRQQFPSAQLIENPENLGFSKGNNVGVRASKGRYICLVNSDIILRPGCIDRMVDYMDQNPRIGILGPNLLNPDLTLQGSCERFPTLWNNFCPAVGLDRLFPRSYFFSSSHLEFHPHDTITEAEVLPAAFWMTRREAFDEVGLLDEDFFFYCEDIDLCSRMQKKGWKVVLFPEAEVVHHHGASSSHQRARFFIEQQRMGLLYWRKHHGIFGVLGITLIKLLHHGIRLPFLLLAYLLKKSSRPRYAERIRGRYKSMLVLLRLG